MNKMITRKAILITCPGTGKDYLPGSEKDLEHMAMFLKSGCGGGWRNEEIVRMVNPSWTDVQCYLDSEKPDYRFVYYSGHGFSSGGERFLQLPGEDVQDLLLLDEVPKQLVVIDACRTYVKPGIAGISPEEGDFYNLNEAARARIIFDQYIRNSAPGKMVVHSTHDGAPARDEFSGSGGAFTNRLLKLATQIKSRQLYQPFFIASLLPVIEKALHQDHFHQCPEIVFSEGELHVPFCLCVPQKIQHVPVRLQPQKDYSWLLAAGVLLIIAGLAGD